MPARRPSWDTASRRHGSPAGRGRSCPFMSSQSSCTPRSTSSRASGSCTRRRTERSARRSASPPRWGSRSSRSRLCDSSWPAHAGPPRGERMRQLLIAGKAVPPSKILCVARNYVDHAKEMGTAVPEEPIFFLKPTTSLLPGGGTILLPRESKRVEVETELAAILGAGGRDVAAGEAMRLVAGYAVFFDITARDLQTKARKDGSPWTASKGFDTFAPISEGVSANRVREPHGLSIRLRVNDAVRQDSN